ncbi:NAD-dependent epimerase/dehydratase family protein [Henriciella mobilis]|uniref:NAD-dependent epimerase/dehydratase family protein n=1 Tax=Henriciella mobilis TaxID=2305467 RepID=UPI001314247B|nr:NAD-dependent epimerase/dehydratase family protein [Henriciella mobilis]
MAPRSETILITGADSFTGRPLIERLQATGHTVVGTTRHPTPGNLCADLMDPDSLRQLVEDAKPTAVIHLAAITFVPDEDVFTMYASNMAGTAALLKALDDASLDLSAVVLPSSAKVYAPPAADGAAIAEDHPRLPADHYGVSKLGTEHLARLYMDRMPITVVRPFNYTGPGQDPKFLVPKLVHAFVENRDIEIGNLDLVRDISDIRRVVEVYTRLIDRPLPGETLNICSGAPIRLSDIPKELEQLTGNSIKLTVNPAFLRPGEPERIVGDATKLEANLPDLPKFELRETLASMIECIQG